MDNESENTLPKKNKSQLKPINTPIYGYLSALTHSFYSRRLYVDVGKRWIGLGLIYLLIAVAIFSIPVGISMGINFKNFFNQQIIEPLEQVPTVMIQNGEASIQKPVPYLIMNKDKQVVIIVDTSGTVNDFTMAYPYLNILINKDKISFSMPTPQFFYNSEQPQRTGVPLVQKFNKSMNSVFDVHQYVSQGFMRNVVIFSQVMVYPMVILILYSFFIVMFPVMALLGQVFSRIFYSFKITYGQASRLLIVSATPAMLLMFLALAFNVLFQGMGIVLIVIMIAYYSYALYCLKAESLQLVAP